MPLDPQIDFDARLVTVRAYGALASEEIFGYQRDVWSRPEVAGFDEMIDMTDVLSLPAAEQTSLRELAKLSVEMDTPTTMSRLAIIAPQDLPFALGRMYEAYRGLMEGSNKEVQVFRSREDAMAWLGQAKESAR